MPTKKITIRSLSSKMDQSVKRMLKLIEEDGDSFAKKAEMYYQKRPELISLVEEFYRIYRTLAERQDLLTSELRKSIPIDLQSQGSNYSDMGSDLPSVWPSPDQRLSLSVSRRKSGPRAAGFEFFLGSTGGNGNTSDACPKDGDDSSSVTDSESECDDCSNNNYSSSVGNNCDQRLNRKIIELEIELRDVKNKLSAAKEEPPKEEGKLRRVRSANSFDLDAKIAGYEDELKIAIEKLETSKKEVARLKKDLQNYKSIDMLLDVKPDVESPDVESPDENRTQELDTHKDNKTQALIEELKITKENLRVSKDEITSLKCQLEVARKDISMWKINLNSEKREVTRLKEKLASLKTSLSDRDLEIRNLKLELSDGGGGGEEISKLLGERGRCEERVKEWESRGRSFEDEIRTIRNEKIELEKKLKEEIKKLKGEISRVVSDGVVYDAEDADQHLHTEHAELVSDAEETGKLIEKLRENIKELEEEIERQKKLISETAEEKREAIRQLCFSLEHYRNGYHTLRRALIGQNKGSPVYAS